MFNIFTIFSHSSICIQVYICKLNQVRPHQHRLPRPLRQPWHPSGGHKELAIRIGWLFLLSNLLPDFWHFWKKNKNLLYPRLWTSARSTRRSPSWLGCLRRSGMARRSWFSLRQSGNAMNWPGDIMSTITITGDILSALLRSSLAWWSSES